MSDPLVNAMIRAGGHDVQTGEALDPKRRAVERLQRRVKTYHDAQRDFEHAKAALAQEVLEQSGLNAGDYVRVSSNCVYRVDGGAVHVHFNAKGDPMLVLTVRRAYRSGRVAASTSTQWLSSMKKMDGVELAKWLGNGSTYKEHGL